LYFSIKKAMHTIPFALKGQQIISIAEAERGLKSHCTCLSCGGRLIAKKGTRNVHHFAHYKGHACANALETALHRRVKALIGTRSSINLPPVYLHRQEWAYLPAQRFAYDSVKEEARIGNLQPDLLLKSGGKVLLVEIAVSHQAPPKKLERLRRLGYAALEIDVLAAYEAHFRQSGEPDVEGFETQIVQGLAYKKWLYNPQQQRAEFHLRKLAAQLRVKHRRYKGFHQYIVEGCPLGKRRWKSGFRQGQAFANVIQDCMHCHRCIHLAFDTAVVGFQDSPQLPSTVHCVGHLEKLPRSKPWQSSV
jgi:hypothetical protein